MYNVLIRALVVFSYLIGRVGTFAPIIKPSAATDGNSPWPHHKSLTQSGAPLWYAAKSQHILVPPVRVFVIELDCCEFTMESSSVVYP